MSKYHKSVKATIVDVIFIYIIVFTTGQLPPPANLQCISTTNRLLVSWDAVIDASCAESTVKYYVTVVRQRDGVVIDSLTDFDDNVAEIINMTTPDIDYNISVSARTTVASCIGQPATIICKRSAANNHSSAGNYCMLLH